MGSISKAIVGFCVNRRRLVVGLGILAALLCGWFAESHFAIDTNTAALISSDVGWRKDEIVYGQAFPQLENLIVAVIDAPSIEAADNAAETLRILLADSPSINRAWRPDSNAYLDRQSLLLADRAELRRIADDLIARKELLGALSADPSLRGLARLISGAMENAATDIKAFEPYLTPIGRIADALNAALAGDKNAPLSWRALFQNKPTAPSELRRLVLIDPKLDFTALQPGEAATAEIRARGAELGFNVHMRLTGPTPLADEEFGTVAEHYELNLTLTLFAVAIVLFLALRSFKIIGAVLMTLAVGLAITFAIGLAIVGQLNLISVAFAVLFIGLGVDFGIQFSTRYREEREKIEPIGTSADAGPNVVARSLVAAAGSIGYCLTLAALSLAAGFFCFLPTKFRGVSELGLIAGIGMIVAFLAAITFMPALLAILNPGRETKFVANPSLAGIDEWIENHRKFVLTTTAVLVLAGAPALFKLKFDSNPMHLRNPKTESVSTFYELVRDPATPLMTLGALAENLPRAQVLAERLETLPEVERAVTLASFAPDNREEKLKIVREAADALAPAFAPARASEPTDAQNVEELDKTLDLLKIAVAQGAPEELKRLTEAFDQLAKSRSERRAGAQELLFRYYPQLIDQLKLALSPQDVGIEAIPVAMKSDWMTSDGRARVEIVPKPEFSQDDTLTSFARSVLTVAPHVVGAPIAIVEAGNTIVDAFLVAGVLAFIAIFTVLYVAMRSVRDVLLALGPLVLAGIMTLEAAQLLGMSIDYANIIALPLMFAVGVAFHIYYLVAWRDGVTDLLASSLTRAIFFSSLTTGAAFGALWLSSHPGTSGMGKLLALSLVFTLLAAFVVVPAFLGPPKGSLPSPRSQG